MLTPAHAHAHLPACMGGWCRLRDRCLRYTAMTYADPSERICTPGRDGDVVGLDVQRAIPVLPSQVVA